MRADRGGFALVAQPSGLVISWRQTHRMAFDELMERVLTLVAEARAMERN